MRKTDKCEWCVDGVCEYYSTYEEQEENESCWGCDGSLEEQLECGQLEHKGDKQ